MMQGTAELSLALWELHAFLGRGSDPGGRPRLMQEISTQSSSSGLAQAGGTLGFECHVDSLPKPDMVNAPLHYTRLNPEPIELIEAWGLDFYLAQVVKYIARAGYKPGQDAIQDLEKARSYLKRKILSLQGKPVVVR